jgi:hypothetical protein
MNKKKAHEEAKTAAEVDPSNLAAIQAQNDAYRESVTVVDNYVKAVGALRDIEIKVAQEAADAKIRIIEDEVRRGLLTKERGELEKVRILAEGARIEAEIKMASAKRTEEAMGRESDAYQKMSAAAKKAADEAYIAKAEALDKYEIKLRATYEKALSEVEKYANEVIRWNEKIAELSMSTEDKIRSAKRKTMDEYGQWTDKQKQADEKLHAAKRALVEGEFPLAEKLAKQAESLYGDLATKIETTVGKQKSVTLSIEEGTDAAIKGYRAVEGVLEDVYNAQKDVAEDAKTKWESTAETIQSLLDQIIVDREMAIEVNLEGIVEAENTIARLIKPATKVITIVTREAKKIGGIVKGLASGGGLPGFGGGDKIHALLEAGEHVIRKEAVRKYGSWFFDMWNSMKVKTSDIGSAVTNRLSNLQPQAQLGYQTGGLAMALPDMGRIELAVGSTAYPVIAEIDVINELKAALEKEGLMRTN